MQPASYIELLPRGVHGSPPLVVVIFVGVVIIIIIGSSSSSNRRAAAWRGQEEERTETLSGCVAPRPGASTLQCVCQLGQYQSGFHPGRCTGVLVLCIGGSPDFVLVSTMMTVGKQLFSGDASNVASAL